MVGWLGDAGQRSAATTAPAQELKLSVQRRMFGFTLAFMAGTAPVYLLLVARTSGLASGWWWSLVAGYLAIGAVGALGTFSGDFRRALWTLHAVVFTCLLIASLERVSIGSGSFWWMSVMPIVAILSGMTLLGLAQGAVVVGYAVADYVLERPAPGVASAMELRVHAGAVLSTVFVIAYLTLAARWRRQLQRALDEATLASAEAVEAKTRLLASLSHEIRNALAGVVGAAELLRSPRSTDAERAQLIALQEQGARALLALTHDMLDYARLDAGKVEIVEEPFCPRTLVLEVIELLALSAHAKGIALAASCDADVPLRLCGDAGRIRQVLHNLVGNAVKFTSQGGVQVRVALDADPALAPAGD
ncbi:MAG TPA: histidine kinase dimerization/phospho-acceptor domain-containing protein, partial [Caldimonas sp.]|nr:histidine kinase dimerization/phospho-acceptor domain-containing protein [Caldimonas sp.]